MGSKARSRNQYALTGFETIEEQNIFFARILLRVRRERLGQFVLAFIIMDEFLMKEVGIS